MQRGVLSKSIVQLENESYVSSMVFAINRTSFGSGALQVDGIAVYRFRQRFSLIQSGCIGQFVLRGRYRSDSDAHCEVHHRKGLS